MRLVERVAERVAERLEGMVLLNVQASSSSSVSSLPVQYIDVASRYLFTRDKKQKGSYKKVSAAPSCGVCQKSK